MSHHRRSVSCCSFCCCYCCIQQMMSEIVALVTCVREHAGPTQQVPLLVVGHCTETFDRSSQTRIENFAVSLSARIPQLVSSYSPQVEISRASAQRLATWSRSCERSVCSTLHPQVFCCAALSVTHRRRRVDVNTLEKDSAAPPPRTALHSVEDMQISRTWI